METLHVCKESLNCQNNHHHLSQSFASSTGNRKREKKKKKRHFQLSYPQTVYFILLSQTELQITALSTYLLETAVWMPPFLTKIWLGSISTTIRSPLLPLASSQVLQAPVTASYKETWVGGSRATIPMRLHLG